MAAMVSSVAKNLMQRLRARYQRQRWQQRQSKWRKKQRISGVSK